MRRFNKIVVHCTATPSGRDLHVKDLRRMHVVERGWSDIGYHFIICLDGTIEVGRPLSMVGAHCYGHNVDSVGIAYVGGLLNGRAKDTRTEAQKESLRLLIGQLTCKAIEEGFGLPRVYGHRDLNPAKECPCFDAVAEYD